MKKMAILLAAMLAAPVFAVVTSQTIVGYYNITGEAGQWQMVGLQVGQVGDPTAPVAINNLVFGDIPLGTQLNILGANGAYTILTYSDEAFDGDEEVTGWADSNGMLASTTQVIGNCFWLYTPTATTGKIRVMGEVFTDAEAFTLTPVRVNGQAMISTPFPAGFNPNSVTWTGVSVGDRLQVVGAQGYYLSYTWEDEAYDEATDDFVAGWADSFGYLVAEDIADLGGGFWITSKISVSVSIPKPQFGLTSVKLDPASGDASNSLSGFLP